MATVHLYPCLLCLKAVVELYISQEQEQNPPHPIGAELQLVCLQQQEMAFRC